MKKTVLITGATSGIGLATAKLLDEQGYTIIASGRNDEKLAELKAEEIAKYTITVDLAEEGMPAKLVERTLSFTNGNLDVLVHSAGILIPGGMGNETEEGFNHQVNTNLNASFALLKHSWSALAKSKGNAVLVSSITGLRAFPGLVSYCVSKAGLDQLVRCAALDGGPLGIRVNGVNPGVVVTELHKRGGMDEENYTKFLEHGKETHPLGRVGNAGEVAETIAFLVSEKANWITGVTMSVDGGRQLTCAR